MRSTKKLLLGMGALLVVVTGGKLVAQSVQDHPTLKGGNTRTGRNLDVPNSNPGRANLRWWAPGGGTRATRDLIIDDTDTNPRTIAPDGFPFGLNTAGEASFNAAQWIGPGFTEGAEDAYQVVVRSRAEVNGGTTYPINRDFRAPTYRYVRATASKSFNEPTVAANGANLRTFTWNFRPASTSAGQYAVFAYLPVQPTLIGSVRTFSQRYYVYQIQYGNGQKYVDIVDRYASGGGFVRLGGGGLTTSRLFAYNGTDPIKVTLYNTVPRDEAGKLRLPNGITNPSDVLVYADAAQAQLTQGYYAASPVSARLDTTDPNSTVVTAVNNVQDVATDNGATVGVSKAVVTNYDYQSGAVRWRYSPLEESSFALLKDNPDALNSFVSDNTVPRQAGNDALLAPISGNDGDSTATYTFNPTDNSSYDIYAFVPKSIPGKQLARAVLYRVTTSEGTFDVRVDQSAGTGWVRVGTGRFKHVVSAVPSDPKAPIVVQVTNGSSNVADQGGTRYAYADAIRLVGQASLNVTSTPVHAKALIKLSPTGTPTATNVVIVADEKGVIHCLDAKGDVDSTGNPVGTTKEYWSYPSTRDSGGVDPNLVEGLDWNGSGTDPKDRLPTAEMPTGFDLSSALVQRVSVTEGGTPVDKDYLYIASRNGRVYCIDMTGRGDFDSTDSATGNTRKVGTTTRVWTYPSTYPSPNPVATSRLGSFRGSLVYGEPISGGPMIYVPTTQGRMYALNALGDPTTKSTTVNWTYPALNQPTLGAIYTTPTFEYGRVYFGTNRKVVDPGGDQPGQMIALEGSTGNVAWSFSRTDANATSLADKRTDDFQSSPISVPASELGGGGNQVYAINQNRIFYCFDADSGTVLWSTDELSSGAVGSLGFTRLLARDSTGAQATQYPIVLVPTQDGHFYGLYAQGNQFNRKGGKLAWGSKVYGDSVIASMAVSNGWLYGADNRGYLYAYNNGDGFITDGDPPAEDVLVPNDPRGNLMRKAKVRIITQDMYRRLRRPEGDADRPTYAEALSNARSNSKDVFEWGETVYVMVYDFPYLTEDTNGDPVDPPIVRINFGADGKPSSGPSVQSRRFDVGVTPNYTDVNPTGVEPGVSTNPEMDGYAILAFPLQNGGTNAVPPGEGEISVSILTAALTDNNNLTSVSLDPSALDPSQAEPTTHAWSRYPLFVANPLGIIVPTENGSTPALNATSNYSLGFVTDPGALAKTDPLRQEALQNASTDIVGTTKLEHLLGAAPATYTNHGQSGRTKIWVIDRSYMSLLRPGGDFGLDNVRVDRKDLAWEGGASTIFKPFDTAFPAYQGFEDLPTNFPNDSLDYPDIAREQIRVTKEPNGDSENPVSFGVSLRAPQKIGGGAIDESTLPGQRVFVPTEFEIDLDIPKYQPANYGPASGVPNSNGGVNRQGYMGRLAVFVDSATNGYLDTAQREAYRSINLSTGVSVDERLRITTPTVDLGSLPGGAGFSSLENRPGSEFDPFASLASLANLFHPWGGAFDDAFQSFGVVNDGNVNLLNVRVAKSSSVSGSVLPLTGYSVASDPLAFLNLQLNLWSDIDTTFSVAPGAAKRVFLQKARVTDRVATQMVSNPIRRANSNLNRTGTVTVDGNELPDVLNPSLEGAVGSRTLKYPPHAPRIGVTVPIGHPVGRYSAQVTVFEGYDDDDNLSLRPNTGFIPGGIEPYTEPGIQLGFNVIESRLTNSYSPKSGVLLDALVAPSSATDTYINSNVQPTALRDSNGSLVVAYASNRTGWTSVATAANYNASATRLFLATLDNGSSFSASSYSTPSESAATGSKLRDLNNWVKASNQSWFRKEVENYPTADPNTLFGSDIISSTVRYDSPAFPTGGFKDPFSSGAFNNAKLVFVGKGTRQSATGQTEESRLMMGGVTTGSDGKISNISGPVVLDSDLQVAKSEPSVLQTGNDTALVFYTGVTAGASSGYYVKYSAGAFGVPSALPFGRGFLSVSGLSASGRTYTGARQPTDPATRPILEMTFTGQLRGRPYPEVYFGRLPLAASATGLELNAQSNGTLGGPSDVFEFLVPQVNDLLERESSGLFRARGVGWKRDALIGLSQIVGTTATDLLVANTRVVEPETGLISYECRLGGRVIFDPSIGSVRFTNSVPSGSARLFLSYTPRFVRLSQSSNQGGGASLSRLLFDDHNISSPGYWRLADGSTVTNQAITNSRFVTTWNRGAGGGLTARPFLASLRFGINLPYRLPTLPDGTPGYRTSGGAVKPAVLGVSLTGGTLNAYQMDPAAGRLYFEASAEGYPVQVTHYAVDDKGNLIEDSPGVPHVYTTDATVGLVTERGQEPISIETAVNEASLCSFLDPFDYVSDRRPPLMWLFWSSTRKGVSDIYFETLSPLWDPVVIAK